MIPPGSSSSFSTRRMTLLDVFRHDTPAAMVYDVDPGPVLLLTTEGVVIQDVEGKKRVQVPMIERLGDDVKESAVALMLVMAARLSGIRKVTTVDEDEVFQMFADLDLSFHRFITVDDHPALPPTLCMANQTAEVTAPSTCESRSQSCGRSMQSFGEVHISTCRFSRQ